MTNGKKRAIINGKDFSKIILYGAVILYLLFLISKVNEKKLYFEIDSYVLPTISIEYRGSFLMNQEDLKRAQEDYPNLYDGINTYEDLRSSKLSVTSTGEWKGAYFPIYSILCLPVKLILQLLHLDQEMAFGITNTLCMSALFLFILCSKKLQKLQKMAAVLLLMATPSFLYVQLISAELMIFSFAGIGVLQFYEKKYKTGAVLITLAGWSNPTVMAIGIVFIFDYYANVLADNKDKNYLTIVKDEFVPSIKLAFCFLPSFLPFIYNTMIGVGNFSPASAAGEGAAIYFQRVLSYLFDPNLGFFSFAPILEAACIGLLFYAVYLKKFRAISFMAAFFGTILAYSLMPHINCGMLYCARYVFWTYPVLVIFIITFGYECFRKKYVFIGVNVISAFLGILLLQSNTNTYYQYTVFNQFTEWIMDHVPSVYNPLHSTFSSRTLHTDGGYNYVTPVVYSNGDGYARKILASKENAEELLAYFDASDNDRKWFEGQVASLTEKEAYISVPAKYHITHNQEYELGTAILFDGDCYNADPYVIKGISYQEEKYRWTEGNEFKMRYALNSQSEWLHGFIELAMVHNDQQNVTVFVNDEEVFQDTVANGENIEFDFKNAGNTKVMEIKVMLPDAVSPEELGKGEDERKLALAVKQIVFTKMDREYELGTDIVFDEDGCNADKYVVQGLSYQEDGYRWTEGKEMDIRCRLAEQAKHLQGWIELNQVYHGQQNVSVLVNGREVFQGVVENGHHIAFDFENAENEEVIDMKILLPDAISPDALGESADPRELALAVKRMVLSKAYEAR